MLVCGVVLTGDTVGEGSGGVAELWKVELAGKLIEPFTTCAYCLGEGGASGIGYRSSYEE